MDMLNDDVDILKQQLDEERSKHENAKKLLADLEQEIQNLEEQLNNEREENEKVVDKFEVLTREAATAMKDHNAKVKKLKEQLKKDQKAAEKKKKDDKKDTKKKGKK